MALVKTNLNGQEVEYDDKEFEISEDIFGTYLHYIGKGKNVTNPNGNISCFRMFADYKGTNLDLSNFNTEKVENMRGMFFNCKKIKFLNLSNFDTSNVTNMNRMFLKCKKLKSLNLENFDTKNVTQLENMFQFCTNLKELDISSFYIDNISIRKVEGIFWNCKSLKKVKVNSNISHFFANHKSFIFEKCGNVNIIPICKKSDERIKELFY